MRTFIIICLVFILSFPFWGTYMFFWFEKEKIRMDIEKKLEAGIDKKKLVQLKFRVAVAQKVLTWNDNREFEFRGHMYDLVSKSVHSDTVIFTCYKDQKETWLKEEKARLIARAIGQDPSRKSQSEKLSDFFKDLYSQHAFSVILSSPLTSSHQFSIFNFPFSSFIISPLAPPPKRG